MSQNCKACTHERRAEIDQAILEGLPLRSIAEGFGLGLATIWRHKRHLERPGTEAEQQAEQAGTQAEQSRSEPEQAYTEPRVTVAEQQEKQPAEQGGTERNTEKQPAGADTTGQAVFIGVIDTLRSELARQGETLKQMLQDYAKEREERARERERADTIIMSLKQDVSELNNRLFLLAEGKQEQGKPPEEQDQEQPKQDTTEPPEDTGKPEQYRFTWTDRVYFLLEDLKRILNKRIF